MKDYLPSFSEPDRKEVLLCLLLISLAQMMVLQVQFSVLLFSSQDDIFFRQLIVTIVTGLTIATKNPA